MYTHDYINVNKLSFKKFITIKFYNLKLNFTQTHTLSYTLLIKLIHLKSILFLETDAMLDA